MRSKLWKPTLFANKAIAAAKANAALKAMAVTVEALEDTATVSLSELALPLQKFS